VLCSG